MHPDYYGEKYLLNEFYNHHYKGPNFNFEVKDSTLMDSIPLEEKDYMDPIFGLFSREFIPAFSIIGTYIGEIDFGYVENKLKQSRRRKEKEIEAKAQAQTNEMQHGTDTSKPKTDSKKQVQSQNQNQSQNQHPTTTPTTAKDDYKFLGNRDQIDSRTFGNYMRYANHQDVPTCRSSIFFVNKDNLFYRGLIDQSQREILPKYIETIGFYTIKDVYPGEEIFINYGPTYWKNRWKRGLFKIRQLSVEQVSQDFDNLELKFNKLQEEHDLLKMQVSWLHAQLEALSAR